MMRVPDLEELNPTFKARNEEWHKTLEQYKAARCVPAASIYPPTHSAPPK